MPKTISASRSAWLVLGLAAALGAAPWPAQASDRDDRDDDEAFTFALWGDMPYLAADVTGPKVPALIADINAARVAFSIFDGDIKSGSSLCTDDVYAAAVARFNEFRAPMVYVAGDNEWTDCHRLNNGGFNALSRLDYVRKTMFDTPFSFGHRKLFLHHQGPRGGLYSENTRFRHKGVAFLGLNVPGSNNNKVKAGECLSSKSARTQADCDADNAEYEARDAANIQYLRETFALARSRGLRGVMVVIQADPSLDLPETETFDERTLPAFDGYNAFLAALLEETKAFAGQVVLVHGDTHFFKVDKPLVNQANLVPNFTRVETFGSPNIHWVKVTVDPRSRNLFTFEPMIVPGN